MKMESKISLIKENKELTITTFNSVLAALYNYTSQTNKVGTDWFENSEDEDEDEDEDTISSLKEEIIKYEMVKNKIQVEDYDNFGELEMSYVLAAYNVVLMRLSNRMSETLKSYELMENIVTKFLGSESSEKD